MSAIGYLSRKLQCQGLAILVEAPHNRLTGSRGGRAGSVQFELFGPIKTTFLNYVRTVGVTFDGGKWVFEANGTEQPFEEHDTYRARPTRSVHFRDVGALLRGDESRRLQRGRARTTSSVYRERGADASERCRDDSCRGARVAGDHAWDGRLATWIAIPADHRLDKLKAMVN